MSSAKQNIPSLSFLCEEPRVDRTNLSLSRYNIVELGDDDDADAELFAEDAGDWSFDNGFIKLYSSCVCGTDRFALNFMMIELRFVLVASGAPAC